MTDKDAKQVIDNMKAELNEAGYSESVSGHWLWRGGNFGAYSANFPSIDSAYRHWEEGKRYAELEAHNRRLLDVAREQQKRLEAHEAFVKRVSEHKVLDIFSAEYADSWDTIAVADHVFFVDFVEEAKKLTGEE